MFKLYIYIIILLLVLNLEKHRIFYVLRLFMEYFPFFSSTKLYLGTTRSPITSFLIKLIHNNNLNRLPKIITTRKYISSL